MPMWNAHTYVWPWLFIQRRVLIPRKATALTIVGELDSHLNLTLNSTATFSFQLRCHLVERRRHYNL